MGGLLLLCLVQRSPPCFPCSPSPVPAAPLRLRPPRAPSLKKDCSGLDRLILLARVSCSSTVRTIRHVLSRLCIDVRDPLSANPSASTARDLPMARSAAVFNRYWRSQWSDCSIGIVAV